MYKKSLVILLLSAILFSNAATAKSPVTTIEKAQTYKYVTYSKQQEVIFTTDAESVNGAFIVPKGTIAEISEVRDWLGYNDYNVLLRFINITDEYGVAYQNAYQWFRQVDIKPYY